MIDMAKEEVISLTQAAKQLPQRRQGKRPHVATLYRWASRGLRGIQLETIQVGGTLCTSLEALQRFFEQLSNPSVSAAVCVGTKSRSQEIEKACKNLEQDGIL